ncbi:MAG: site-2 protease family protein [Saprospiraceae bacterium]|nr:site-2 protease family protein [Saprospiraceae bacterium]
MNSAFKIATLFGIPIKIHWTFALLLLWVVYVSQSGLEEWNWKLLARTGALVAALFICVILHELGHALTARRYGIRTRNILLLPIGGLAVLDRLPEKPLQELWVALAGPLVNFVLALIFLPILLFLQPYGLGELVYALLHPERSNVFLDFQASATERFLFFMVMINLFVGAFNLLPIFPMDGGRILRALLSIVLKRLQATRIAVFVGQASVVAFIGYTFFTDGTVNWATLLIGIFVFFSAGWEYRTIRDENFLERFKVGDVYRGLFTKLYEDDSLALALECIKRGPERNFLVFDEWQNLKGVLSEQNTLNGVARADATRLRIADLMYAAPEALWPTDDLKKAVNLLQKETHPILPVYEGERLVGVLDAQGVDHFIHIQKFLNAPSGA